MKDRHRILCQVNPRSALDSCGFGPRNLGHGTSARRIAIITHTHLLSVRTGTGLLDSFSAAQADGPGTDRPAHNQAPCQFLQSYSPRSRHHQRQPHQYVHAYHGHVALYDDDSLAAGRFYCRVAASLPGRLRTGLSAFVGGPVPSYWGDVRCARDVAHNIDRAKARLASEQQTDVGSPHAIINQ